MAVLLLSSTKQAQEVLKRLPTYNMKAVHSYKRPYHHLNTANHVSGALYGVARQLVAFVSKLHRQAIMRSVQFVRHL